MIGYLQGSICHYQGNRVVLLVQGVGYEVELPKRIAEKTTLHSEMALWIHQVIREDSSELYGFLSIEDREAYRLILKAPQVGPKVALAILDVFSASALAQVGLLGTTDALLQVKGLGGKLADRLIVDLKSWTSKGLLRADAHENPMVNISTAQSEALQALVQLGYKEAQVRKVLQGQESDLTAQALIRNALQILSNRGV